MRAAASTLARATVDSKQRHQQARKEVLCLASELQEVNQNLRTVYTQLRYRVCAPVLLEHTSVPLPGMR